MQKSHGPSVFFSGSVSSWSLWKKGEYCENALTCGYYPISTITNGLTRCCCCSTAIEAPVTWSTPWFRNPPTLDPDDDSCSHCASESKRESKRAMFRSEFIMVEKCVLCMMDELLYSICENIVRLTSKRERRSGHGSHFIFCLERYCWMDLITSNSGQRKLYRKSVTHIQRDI